MAKVKKIRKTRYKMTLNKEEIECLAALIYCHAPIVDNSPLIDMSGDILFGIMKIGECVADKQEEIVQKYRNYLYGYRTEKK
jgi:hypothetical protein